MKKIILIVAGTIALGLGILGIFLPLLPTTPLLLLAASCYFYGSEKFYNRLMSHKVLGNYIRSFREDHAIPLKAKIVSVTMVWVTLLYCTFVIANALWMRIMFIVLAAAISCHILSYKTRKKQ